MNPNLEFIESLPLKTDLKDQFERQLSDARIESSARVTEIVAFREADGAGFSRRSDVVPLAVEAGYIQPVEGVEEFSDELQPILLGEIKRFRRAEIEADEVAFVKRIAPEARRAIRAEIAVVVQVDIVGQP